MHFREESFGREFSDAFEPVWKTLDTLLATDLSAVDALCLVFDAHESFVQFRKEVVDRGRAPVLIGSPRLKYVVRKDSRYRRVRCDTDVVQDVGRSTLHWEDLLRVLARSHMYIDGYGWVRWHPPAITIFSGQFCSKIVSLFRRLFRFYAYSTIFAYSAGSTEMPVNASDIPHELLDDIVKFFALKDVADAELSESQVRNHVYINKREMGLISLVCRRWATHVRPAIFQDITLSRREDVLSLLALIKHPSSRIAGYVKAIQISYSVTEYPSKPWVHTVYTVLMPKLPWCKAKTPFEVKGPLPSGRFMKSIHHQLPSWAPVFSLGIRKLGLTDLRFRRFDDFIRLLREIPLLEELNASRVTWERTDDDAALLVTSYLCKRKSLGEGFVRPAMSDPGYVMSGCTDNGAVGWLPFLLSPTWSTRLVQDEVSSICQLTSILASSIDVDEFPQWKAQSYRDPVVSHKLSFSAALRSSELIHQVSAYVLEPAIPGLAHRIGAFVMHFNDVITGREFTDAFDPTWKAVDKLLATGLSAVQALCLVFDEPDDLVLFRKEVADKGKTPYLSHSPRSKYILMKDTHYVQVRFIGDSMEDVGEYNAFCTANAVVLETHSNLAGEATLHWEILIYT
ncbi:hypothetical protein NM688_g8979 [Phlebia brevispora]|uniref:Uncharacterized protein n=1 Tax=Phlebia brevispora TaxID=194682 RepID=A0ACC1RKZ5_9APHY|nr:hypothetical protein NM688_g8979 [Phlebia brevispora]